MVLPFISLIFAVYFFELSRPDNVDIFLPHGILDYVRGGCSRPCGFKRDNFEKGGLLVAFFVKKVS